MRLDRLGSGEALAGAGGLLLLVALFLPWFDQANAWEAFDVVDVILFGAALAGISVGIVTAVNAKTDAPVASAALAVPVGFLASVLVLYRVLNPVADLDRRFGLFLGLVASLAVTYGCWRAVRDERTQ